MICPKNARLASLKDLVCTAAWDKDNGSVDSSADRSLVGDELPEVIPSDSYPESIDDGDRTGRFFSEREVVSVGGVAIGFLARMDQLVRRLDPPGCIREVKFGEPAANPIAYNVSPRLTCSSRYSETSTRYPSISNNACPATTLSDVSSIVHSGNS